MIWLFVVVAAAATFVIAAVAVGSVTASQSLKPRRALYDLEQAVEFVADRLPGDVTATISYEDVRRVLSWHVDYLSAKGVASYRTDDDMNPSLVVVSDDEPVAWILGEADRVGMVIADEHVVEILRAQDDYYRSIGAIGDAVDEPTLDD
jgi:hypothetical protein